MAALAAARALCFCEVFARGEQFWSDTDAPGAQYGTFGMSYSPSAARGQEYRNARVTAAYTLRRDEAEAIGHLFVVQGQIAF